MVALPHYSIHKKLMAMSLWATSAALLLASAAFMIGDFLTYRTALVKRLSSLEEIISLNTVAAVVFNDSIAATKTLASLKALPSVKAAGIYTAIGHVFAAWHRDPNEPFSLPPLPAGGKETFHFDGDSLVMFRPMVLDNTVIGTIYIKSDLTELTTRLQRYAVIGVGVLIVSILVAAGIAFQVGKKISEPILHLTKTAKAVSEDKDYSVRAAGGGSDEVGLLIRSFNDMLTKIHEDGQALQQAHNELEKRVQKRTAQLTAANKELEAFSYSVSHDLRTPLRAIDGFSRELLQNQNDRLDDQGKTDLKRIRAATQRMGDLIDDLLKLSRVTRSEMVLKTVDLSALVAKILEELQSLSPQRQVTCVIASNLSAQGDPELLRVALENLVGNAWKFTQKRDDAKVEFGLTDHKSKKAFFVRDNGAGFDMAYSGKLFGVFQRLHDAKEYPGTGIGLATVQRIIQRHGGQIWADAAVDQGATFYFTLP